MRRPDQAPRQPAHQLLAAGHEADVRTAVARGEAQLLALTDRDIGAVLAGRREEGEADRVDACDGERPCIVRPPDQVGSVDEESKKIRLLKDQRGGLGVRFAALPDLDPAAFTERPQDVDILGMHVAGDEDFFSSVMNRGHHGRLGHGGRPVVQGSVGDVEGRELGDQGLKFVDRLQGALARLRLVGRVSGVKLRFGSHGRHRGRYEAAIDTATAKCQPVRKHTVARRQRRDLRDRFELGQTVGQLEPRYAKGSRDVAQQAFHRVDADCRQHLGALFW
ncbi:MAG: hypothetical protein E6I73_03530 [Chloroflexi bacterium]|nr:MAG: hypothetical protein E6I73_03530 [Chloroflexota bacterium]